MRQSRDISCKFELEPQHCDWLSTAIVRSGALPTGKSKEVAVYLDADDAAIGNHGLALGIRHSAEVSAASVKAAVDKAARGLTAPNGWTQFIEPVSAATPSGPRRLRSVLKRHDSGTKALFRTETQGNRWCLNSNALEINLERGRVAASRKHASFATVTFVRKKAPTADFFRFVTEIVDPTKLRMSAAGDALWGYRLCGKLRSAHVSAFAPKLAANMGAARAFRAIARSCLDHFLLNEAAIRLGRDSEAVHQCRVALRRFSTCLRLFSPLVAGASCDALRLDLKELAGHLQQARDLDVLLAQVIEPAVGARPRRQVRDVVEMIEARRTAAYDGLVAALSTPQTVQLFTRLLVWIEAGDWRLDPKRDEARRETIGAFVTRKLAKARRKFNRHCDALDAAGDDERHRIRIRAKNLRYSAEFFESLVAPKASARKDAAGKTARKRHHAFIAALKDLQTTLGEENDLRMARRFLASLADEIAASGPARGRRTKLAGIEAIAAGLTGQADFEKRLAKARHALAAVKPFWSGIAPAARGPA